MSVQILNKSYNRVDYHNNSNKISKRVNEDLTSKEKYFQDILEEAKNFFSITSNNSADDWILRCLNEAKKNNNGGSAIYQLSCNESRLFGKVFPRGFQKALAVGFIMEKMEDAFDLDGVFALQKFKNHIRKSTELTDKIRKELLANLKDEYFEHISLSNSEGIQLLSEVKFGNTEYENILNLTAYKKECAPVRANVFCAKFIQWSIDMNKIINDVNLSFSSPEFSLTKDGVVLLENGDCFLSLRKFIMNSRLKPISEDYLKILKIPVKEFFHKLRVYFDASPSSDILDNNEEFHNEKKDRIMLIINNIAESKEYNPHDENNPKDLSQQNYLYFMRKFFDYTRLRKEVDTLKPILESIENLRKSFNTVGQGNYKSLQNIYESKLFVVSQIELMQEACTNSFIMF